MKSWADAKSQKGAYKILDNATKCADQNPGYKVFDADGKVVYEPKAAEPAVKVPFLVKVSISDLNIRKGPGTDYDRVQFIPIGVYTIMEVRNGKGSFAGGRVDYDEFARMADAFIEAGFNYFDTAHGYIGGQSETAIRDCVSKRYDRSRFLLTDKLTDPYFRKQEDIRPFFQQQYQEEIESIRREKISADNVYNYLILFHDAYDQLPDIWKKKFFQSFIQEIQLYPEQQENGQVLKSMKFKFPVFYNGQTIEEIRWDKENTVETVCLLTHS